MNMRYKSIDGEVVYKIFEGDSDWGTDKPASLLKEMPDGYNVKVYHGEIKPANKAKKK